MTVTAAVELEVWLCRTTDMSQIAQLNVHNRQLQLQLDNQGTFTGWVHLLDAAASEIVIHQTSIRIDRNGETIWSGPIFQANDNSSGTTGNQEGDDQCQITAMGWFQILNQRLLHTGSEFTDMLAAPNGVAWQAQFGSYNQVGVDTAVQLAYSATEFPTTTDAVIMFDLLNRANIDSPTLITPGNIFGAPIQRNLTLQRFQNIGQQITQLVNVESGCDFVVDPVSRKMDLYGPGASPSPDIANGFGVDRGQGCLFTYPGNCTAIQRTGDGTQTQNRVEAIGEYAVGRADDLGSQSENGLFEANDQLSEVVDPNILAAYANAEVTVRAQPWTITTFTPRGVMKSDIENGISGIPQPFDDFQIGDIVYTVIDRGRVQVGSSSNPQQTRVFGFTIAWDDDGVEKLSNVQTTFQALGTSA